MGGGVFLSVVMITVPPRGLQQVRSNQNRRDIPYEPAATTIRLSARGRRGRLPPHLGELRLCTAAHSGLRCSRWPRGECGTGQPCRRRLLHLFQFSFRYTTTLSPLSLSLRRCLSPLAPDASLRGGLAARRLPFISGSSCSMVLPPRLQSVHGESS